MSTQSGKRLRIRRGDGTRTLANGELEFDYVNSKLRVGDGSSVGGIGRAGQSGFNLTRASAGYVFPSETPGVSPFVYSYVGSVRGYALGGATPSNTDTMEKFPFSSDTSATDIGELAAARFYGGGAQSQTDGYYVGGQNGGIYDAIQKFPFSSDTNAVDVAETANPFAAGSYHSSETHGYTAGNLQTTDSRDQRINKFPFSSDSPGANSAALGERRRYVSGGSYGNVAGYMMGGAISNTYQDTVRKFSFSSDADATDVGELPAVLGAGSTNSSETHAYNNGGRRPGGVNTIEKYTFATDGPAVDIGELATSTVDTSGASSTASGYVTGGAPPNSGNTGLDKYSFSSDGSAKDIGEITQARRKPTGVHV